MRLQRIAVTVGLSFALGALVDTALTWRLHELESGDAAEITPERSDVMRELDALATPEPAALVTREPAALAAAAARPAAASPSEERRDAAPTSTAGIVPGAADVDLLRRRGLELPVAGLKRSALHDTFSDSRALGRPHEAIDIMATKGTLVLAVDDGTVAKLFTSLAGGLTLYQFDPSGTYSYYYAHLDAYAPGIRDGQPLKRGQTIGYVGSTGNASKDAPHLHFGIYRLTAERQWWKGEPINPYSVFR